jgi:natural product precursor
MKKTKRLQLRKLTIKQLTDKEQSIVIGGESQNGSDDCCSAGKPSCPKTV